jgi:hypothetical protein
VFFCDFWVILGKIYKIFNLYYLYLVNLLHVYLKKMVKVKLIDLFNVRFEQMENKINQEITALEEDGVTIKEVKVLGDSLKNAGIFIIYE